VSTLRHSLFDQRHGLLHGQEAGCESWKPLDQTEVWPFFFLVATVAEKSFEAEDQMIQLKVNGIDRSFDGDPEMPLLWYLRDILGLTGTKFGCGIALCGACTVHKDGEALRSCVSPMSSLAGAAIRTIEDIGAGGLHPVQKMWMQFNVPQCGYCQSGQIMQAIAMLKEKPKPTDQDIDEGMAANICRCGTYQRIRAAIKAAAEKNA
jgi:isoquinoline 1-oxidoreductase alpha subunit